MVFIADDESVLSSIATTISPSTSHGGAYPLNLWYPIIIPYNYQTDKSSPSTSQASVAALTKYGTFGYKLVGDNIDFTVNARYMRIDGRQNQSLHYFHCFAIRDRINFSHLPFKKAPVASSTHSPTDLEKMAKDMLPSQLDDDAMSRNAAILLSRLLATHLPYFKSTCSDVVTWHIEHDYYTEMSRRSDVVRFWQRKL